jgi:hypothetical protein
MRKLFHLLAPVAVLVGQTVSPIQVHTVASIQSPAQIEEQIDAPKSHIQLDFTNPLDPIETIENKPNFETDVLAPLRVAQAAEAQQEAAAQAAAQAAALAAAAAARAAAQVAAHTASTLGDAWASLRACEAGGDYTRNSGNGYYGAYQFDIQTWGNFDGYVRPDLAPATVQDTKAQQVQAVRGWYPWPACSYKLGLL